MTASRRSEFWVRHVLAEIRHRGDPDHQFEVSTESSFGSIGTNRLPIVAKAIAHQPATSMGGRYRVALNGESFDFREQLSRLRITGDSRANQSDTWFVASAIEQLGPERVVTEMTWEGALLALDTTDGSLIAARDHLGIKPLYRTAFDDGVAFASEAKALVRLPGRGIIENIPPGSLEIYAASGDRMSSSSWWKPRSSADEPVPGAPTRLLELLREAVRLRIPADQEFAVSLSGGLDSSAVLALAVQLGSRPRAYVLGGRESLDLLHARALCEEWGVPLIEVEPMPSARLKARLTEVVATTETWEWQVINHAAAMLPLTERIHDDGLRVVLSGEGADEAFAGYRPSASLSVKQEQLRRLDELHRTNCRRIDRVGMRSQLEFRVPFLDRHVVEFALRLPPEALVQGGKGKEVLRRAMAGILPDSIINREKLSFAKGAGYRYAGDMHPTVFGDLSEKLRDIAHLPRDHRARFDVEQLFLAVFDGLGYCDIADVAEGSL